MSADTIDLLYKLIENLCHEIRGVRETADAQAKELNALAVSMARIEEGVKKSSCPGTCDKLDTRIGKLEEALDKRLTSSEKRIDDIEKEVVAVKASWKTLCIIAGAATTIGTVAGWVLEHFVLKT